MINNTFLVQQDMGIVRSLTEGGVERLEPRLMQLLCILASHEGELMGRERLTLEVWDNYGNADEGLTQAISYLRKVLKDDNKRIIETVPKKGYVLHAVIGEALPGVGKPVHSFFPRKRVMWLTVLLIVVILAGGYWFFGHKNQRISPDLVPGGNVADTSSIKNSGIPKSKDSNHNADQLPDSNKRSVRSPNLEKR